MNKDEFINIYALSSSHWWYQGMKNISLTLLKKYLSTKNKIKVLDAGCGTGYMLPYLSIFGDVQGIDNSDEAIRICHEQKFYMAQKASIEEMPFNNDSFDLLTSFDVIYHKEVKDDLKALSEFNRVLKPKGYLMIRVPADSVPLSSHDKVVHTRQRYSKKELKEKINQSGFKIIKLSYANFFLYPFAYLKRALEDDNDNINSDIKKTSRIINTTLKNILSFEGKLLKTINLPWGLSLICIAQKK